MKIERKTSILINLELTNGCKVVMPKLSDVPKDRAITLIADNEKALDSQLIQIRNECTKALDELRNG